MNLGTFWIGAQRALICAEARARGRARRELLTNGEHEAALVHAAFPSVVWVGVLVDSIQGEGDVTGGTLVYLVQVVLFTPQLLGVPALRSSCSGRWGMCLCDSPKSCWGSNYWFPSAAAERHIPAAPPGLLVLMFFLAGLGQHPFQTFSAHWQGRYRIGLSAAHQEPKNKENFCCHGNGVQHLSPPPARWENTLAHITHFTSQVWASPSGKRKLNWGYVLGGLSLSIPGVRFVSFRARSLQETRPTSEHCSSCRTNILLSVTQAGSIRELAHQDREYS